MYIHTCMHMMRPGAQSCSAENLPICRSIFMRVYVDVYMHICIYADAYVCVCIYTHVCVYIYIHMYLLGLEGFGLFRELRLRARGSKYPSMCRYLDPGSISNNILLCFLGFLGIQPGSQKEVN